MLLETAVSVEAKHIGPKYSNTLGLPVVKKEKGNFVYCTLICLLSSCTYVLLCIFLYYVVLLFTIGMFVIFFFIIIKKGLRLYLIL